MTRTLYCLFLMTCLLACKGETAAFDAVADEVCACKDRPCAELAMAKTKELGKTLTEGKSEAELVKLAGKLAEIQSRMKKCINELPPVPGEMGKADGPADPHGAPGAGHGGAPSPH